ncbi:MAG: hypothetical protein ACU843_00750 [Gammaproteobacteria bacterium]
MIGNFSAEGSYSSGTIGKLVYAGIIWLLSSSALATGPSRISDDAIPMQQIDDRPFTLELGPRFLGSGDIGPVFELPTGAVWQPSLLFFGTIRSAFQTFDPGDNARGVTEWVNRADLFGQVTLSGTERLVVGIRPLDRRGQFTGYNFDPRGETFDAFNANVRTLFFEGEFGEIFPNLDPTDELPLDIGFSVGRQPLFFQEGVLVNVDAIDAVGLAKDSISLFGSNDFRISAVYAWNFIFRGNNATALDRSLLNQEDKSASLVGIFTETDLSWSTVRFDTVYVDANEQTGRGFYVGLSGIQRIGPFNTTFRVNSSVALDKETVDVRNGTLFLGEVSWTPTGTLNNLYANAFWGIDEFTSAARSPTAGGPLGRTGILFAAVGLGNYGAPLGNQANHSVGGAIGYQMFFDNTRRQLILEAGGRTRTDGIDAAQGAIGFQLQQALWQNFILDFSSFYSYHERFHSGYGARSELRINF